MRKTVFAIAALMSMLAAPVLAADHAVTIKDFKFDPPTIEVAVGDTITFTNEDNAPHTATAGDGAFDTGRLGKGESKSVTVAAAGGHDYICTFHPMMKGTVSAK